MLSVDLENQKYRNTLLKLFEKQYAFHALARWKAASGFADGGDAAGDAAGHVHHDGARRNGHVARQEPEIGHRQAEGGELNARDAAGHRKVTSVAFCAIDR